MTKTQMNELKEKLIRIQNLANKESEGYERLKAEYYALARKAAGRG